MEYRLRHLPAAPRRYGYMTESAISRIYSYARVEPIYGGTSEIQKVNIAKSLR